jgi:hypothetical protein
MKALLMTIGLALMSTSAFGYDCWDYSTRAIRQNNAQNAVNCGFSGARWHSNWQVHFDWCSSAGISPAGNEDRARQSGLLSCFNRSAFIEDCNYYADRAVRQFRASQALYCGFSGARWHANRGVHYDWCASGQPFASLNSEDQARLSALRLCVSR